MWQSAVVIFPSDISSICCLKENQNQVDEVLDQTVDPAQRPERECSFCLGLKNILTTYGKCCKPVPGDDIIGYITRGRGATIHRQDCPNILRIKDRDRIVRVAWGEPQLTFPVEIQIKAYDRQGLMGDISSQLTDENINVKDIKINVTHNLAYLDLTVEISDIAQLSRVLTKIENLPNVMEAHRLKPG